MYCLKFWFEHGGGCLWSANDEARAAFGYKVNYNALPIGDTLKRTLKALEDRYCTYLNWEDPGAPSPWTNEEKHLFLKDAEQAYHALCTELGKAYLIENQSGTCVSIVY